MRRFVGSACAIAVAGVACRGGPRPSIPDAGASRVGGDAIAAPGGLLLEASLRDPDGAWSRLQQGAGGALAVLPPTLGQLACTLLGVDEGLGALVDGHATSYAVAVERPLAGGAGGTRSRPAKNRASCSGPRR